MSDDTADSRPCEMPPGMAPRLDTAFNAFDKALLDNETPIMAGLVLFWAPCKIHGGSIDDEVWLREDLEPADVAEIRARLATFLAAVNTLYPPV